MSSRMNRRRFLQAVTASAGAGYFYTATALSADRAGRGPNGRIAVAGIGIAKLVNEADPQGLLGGEALAR